MGDFIPQCPKCDKPMDKGYVPDVAYGGVFETSWAPGEPEQRRFVGGIKYRANELIPLRAHRCPKCGLVELYARPG